MENIAEKPLRRKDPVEMSYQLLWDALAPRPVCDQECTY